MPVKLLDTILAQVEDAHGELSVYPPITVDWYARAQETVRMLVSWLTSVSGTLCDYVQGVLNAPEDLRHAWSKLSKFVEISSAELELFGKYLDNEGTLLEYIPGNIVSSIIEKYLINNFSLGGLKSNGPSDYPDLYLSSNDYSMLPRFKRKVEKYGAALKGGRPVRIPDGLEIKSCRSRFAVDCHYPHMGLHLAVLYDTVRAKTVVNDIMVAYLKSADYRESKRATRATTVKYSFGAERFVSILKQER